MKLTWEVWFGAGRRLGVGLVLALGLLQILMAGVARAQAVTTTTVQGTVYLASGQVGAGTVNVSWPTFTTANGLSIAAGHMMVTIAPDGYLSVNLAPNLGATPAGLYYTAVYQMSDGTTSTQYWVVPAAAQATLAQVQSQLMPAAQAVQAVSKAYVDQAIAELTGSLLTASGGTLTGNLYLNGDPTVPLQASDKHYVDSTFSLELPISGGSMTGPLMLSGDPTVPLQASDKNYVDTQVSSALPIIGGTVSGELTAKQIGAVYQVDQFPGADFGAKLQSCLSSLSSSYGGTCDARNFAGTLAMGSNLTIATANATMLLPCGTIATTNQVIVTAGTRNVTLRGCALRGASTASGSQGGTVFLYSGTSAMVQVGDPTYAVDTMGFHIDDVVINTTASTNASAQGLVAFRTQEMDVQSLYLLGNANQTGMTLDGTGNYTGGSFYSDQFVGFQTAVNAIGHQAANPATTDWMNASTLVRLHIDCPTSGGNPISGTVGINLQQGDGNTFTGGDVENCGTALHLGPNAQGNTIVGLRNENSTNQVVADAGSSYNNWMTGGTMFTGKLTDNGTRNSFLDTFHRTFNGMNGDWYGSQQDATVTNHWRLGIGTGNERGLLNEIQTDYGYRWVDGYTDATAGEQYYQVQDLFNNVPRLSIGQYNNGQSSTNNQSVLNAAGTGAVVLNGSNNAGTGGVVFGSGGPSETTVATVDKAGNAQFNGTLQVAGVSTLIGTPTVKNQLDAEIDAVLWAGLTQSQKESLIYKDWNGNSQWYAEKDQYNNWMLNSAVGGLDSFKAYQSTNSGDTYVNASNGSGAVRVNYETGAGTAFKVYGGSSSSLYASFTGPTSIAFPGLAASSGHNCVQIDNSGYITSTGVACGSGSGTVGSANSGQIAYYTGNGTSIGGLSTVPVSAGGTGAATAAAALAGLAGVPNTTTVNGHALSGNVTVSASDVTTGTLPHAQLPSLVSGDIPNNAANTTGTASNVTGMVALANGGTGATTAAAALANLFGVTNTTAVNGHALNGNVTVSASDLTTGTLPHAQLPSLVSGDIPNNAANTSGTASNVTGMVALGNGGTGAATAAGALANLAGVANTTTVNGHALSGNVTVSASDVTTGTLPHAQLPGLLSGDIPNNGANTTGTAANVTGMVALGNGGTGATTAAAAAANIVNGNPIAPSSINSSGTVQGAVVSAPNVTGGINGGLATSQSSLKQDARLCTDINISTSAGTTTLTSSTGCANFTSADNSRIALLYPSNAINALALNAAGTGWNQNDRFTIAGGTGGIGIVTAVNASNVPTAIQLENSGTGFAIATGSATSAISPSTGTGLTVNITSLGGSGRSYAGGLTFVSSTQATLNSTYSGVNATGATMILGTDDGQAFNTMITSQIAANSVKGELSLGCKPIITTQTLLIAGGRGIEVKGCGLASGINANGTAGSASGTTIISAIPAHPVTLAVSGTTVTLTDSLGHGYTNTYCTKTGAQCLVNVQGTSQSALSNTFLINAGSITSTTLTFTVATSGLSSDSGYMPFNDVVKVQNCYGCSVHDLNIMGSDQPSTKPRALIDTNDLSTGPFPNSLNTFYNLYLGNMTGFGALPGSMYMSDSTAMYAILADPAMIQDDRNQVRNVHVMNADVCFGAEQSQPVDWTFSGTIGCYFSGAAFALLDDTWWHVSGTMENLQNGLDFLLANNSHLDIAKHNEETDGAARVYSPIIGGPGDTTPGTSMLLEAFASTCCGMPGGTLSIDHGEYPPSGHLPVNGDMIWHNGSGIDVRLNDFTFGSTGNLSEPVLVPLVDLSANPGNRAVFLCKGCTGLTGQNFKLPTPGATAASHFVVVENDAANGNQNGVPSHGINILAGNDSTIFDDFRQDIPAKMRIMGGYLNVPQVLSPSYVYNIIPAVPASTTYYYKVTSVSGSNEALPIGEYSFTNGPAAISGSSTVTGTFYPVVGADSYKIYRTAAGGASGSEGYSMTVPANQFTGQIVPRGGTPNSFTDSTPDGSLGAAPPSTNSTGKINAGGGYQVNGSPLATGNLSDWTDSGVASGSVPVWNSSTGKWTPGTPTNLLPAAPSTAGDVVCAEAADPTIGAQVVSAVSSTSTTLTFTIANAESYFLQNQKVQSQNNTTTGYNNGGSNPAFWIVSSVTGTAVTVTSTANPGAGTAGGTLSLYCSNQSLDGSLNYIAFNTTYTFPANTLGSTILSVKARPQFGVFSSASAASVATFAWSMNSTNIWKSGSLTNLAPANSLANGAGTYPVDLTFLPGYSSATYTTVSPFTLGGLTPLTDTEGLTGTGLPPLAISTGISQVLSLQMKYKATGVASGTYTIGGTITGTTGQTCTLASFNDSSTATATVALTGTNTIASSTALTMTARGGGATAAPTSATLGNGTATCSGTATISTVLGGSPGNALLLYGLVLTP